MAVKRIPILLLLCSSVQCLFGRNFRDGRSSLRRPASLPSLRAGSSPDKITGPVVEYAGEEPPRRALVVLDAFCPYHGVYLANRARDYPGVAVVFVLSNYLRAFLQATEPENGAQWEAAKLPDEQTVAEWKARLGNDVEWVGLYCESDSGLADAEVLRKLLRVQCKDDPVIFEARRHKFLMNQHVGKAGLPVSKQKLCGTPKEAADFAEGLLRSRGRVVVKPFRGVATESVHLCENLDQAVGAWEQIVSTKVFGTSNMHSSVLVQEFLTGTEYAVDVVARDGQYKVAAVWRYEKRPANGAAFCYFKTELVDCTSDPRVSSVVGYVNRALNALGVRWGISHNEVIVTEDHGPMLVEINCRQHNMDFCPLTMACIGYNALDMTLDAFLANHEEWGQFPDVPKLRAAGCMVHLVNYKAGTLVQTHHLDDLRELPSVLDWEIYEDYLTPGAEIEPTVDIRSDAGWVQLINENSSQLDEDYAKIVDWMLTMFQVEEN